MFFLLSKILAFIIQPLNWIIVLLLLSFWKYKKPIGRKFLISSISLLLFFTNPFLINLSFNLWEGDKLEYNSLSSYNVAVVLGGFSNTYGKPEDRVHFQKGSDRILHALELYKLNKVDKLLLSGGTSRILGEKKYESLTLVPFLLHMGVKKEDIIIESKSRNTWENAVYSAEILNSNFDKPKILLITSAFHMPRSKACFEEIGLGIDCFPTDYYGNDFHWSPETTILPNTSALKQWNILIKEWIGIIAYNISGYN